MLPTKEDIKTEFKQSFTDDVIIALVAFANAKGGKVYVGMRDNGTVCGVSLGKEALQTWLNEIKQKTEPSIIPDLEVIDVQGKTVVMLTVQEYPVKPVSTKGRYYVRQANSNHLMSAFEISNSILQTKNSSWDYYIDNEHTINDISLDKVQLCIDKMRRRGVNITEQPIDFLKKKEFLKDNNLTYGGYLLFKAREDIMTTVELGFFQDTNGIIIKDSSRLKNCLVSQVDDVMEYVKKHINLAIEIVATQVENVQHWDYPLEAIREIVLNMIVHRDYRSSADSVVKIYPDRIEFYNPGGLPDDLTIDDLMTNNYSSRPRNKQIADTFKEMGDIEKYGSGIRRVVNMCVDYGLPKPQWKQNSGGILVTVWKDGGLNGQLNDQLNGELNLQSVDNDDVVMVSRDQLNGVLNGQLNDQLKLQNTDNENVVNIVGGQLNDQLNGELNFGELNGGLNGELNLQRANNKDIATTTNGELNGGLNGELKSILQRAYSCISRNQGCNLIQLSEKINVPFDTVEKHVRVLLAKGLIVRKGGKKTGGYYLFNALNEPEERTLAHIKDNPGCNLTQMSESLNVPFDTLEKQVRVLVAKNFIERRGSKKTGGYYLK